MLNILIRIFAKINNMKLSLSLSKVLFHNDVGFLSNISGKLLILISKKSNILVDKYGTDLKNNHYQWLSLEENNFKKLDLIRNKFNTLCKNKKIPKSLRLEIHSDFVSEEKSRNILKLCEEILPLKIYDRLEMYFNKKVAIDNIHIYRTHSSLNFKNFDRFLYGSTDQWHIDRSPINRIKVFVLLHEINQKHGPMEFYTYNTKTKKNICGKQNDVLIINTNYLLHRATEPNKNNTRDLLCFNFKTI